MPPPRCGRRSATSKGGPSSCRSCQHLRGFGRLKPGVTIAEATAEMNAIREQMRREHPTDYDAGTIARGAAARRAHRPRCGRRSTSCSGAVGFVLLIACANVANLLLARAVTRQRELALRAVLGAGRRRIVRQLLTESFMLSAGGAAAGVALATFAVRGLAALAPVSLPRLEHVAVDGRVLAFTAAIAVVTGLFFGLVPAWRGSAAGAQRKLAVDSRGSVGGRSRARAFLVVADLVLALVLLAGAGLMLRTMVVAHQGQPGVRRGSRPLACSSPWWARPTPPTRMSCRSSSGRSTGSARCPASNAPRWSARFRSAATATARAFTSKGG